jgi:hypothetical protein
MNIVVKTFDLATGEQTNERLIDFSMHDGRVWLQKHVAWACNNNHAVGVCNEADEKLAA